MIFLLLGERLFFLELLLDEEELPLLLAVDFLHPVQFPLHSFKNLLAFLSLAANATCFCVIISLSLLVVILKSLLLVAQNDDLLLQFEDFLLEFASLLIEDPIHIPNFILEAAFYLRT
jgi:hypothetical protein